MKRVLLFFLLSSCSYRWQPDYPQGERPSLCIPFIAGDGDGALTSELIRAVTSSGMADVHYREGDYRLHIAFVGGETKIVGYRRDRQKVSGGLRREIVACEGRAITTVEATLYEGNSERIAYGPYRISPSADYDYLDGDSIQDLAFVDVAGIPQTVLAFSLGQLESNEAAQETASRPLHAKLAKKIVDAIFSEW